MKKNEAISILATSVRPREQKNRARYDEAVKMAINALNEPERKTGKWIEFPNHNAYKCSECGRVIETTDGKRFVYKHFPFCHCGARMVQEGEDSAD